MLLSPPERKLSKYVATYIWFLKAWVRGADGNGPHPKEKWKQWWVTQSQTLLLRRREDGCPLMSVYPGMSLPRSEEATRLSPGTLWL